MTERFSPSLAPAGVVGLRFFSVLNELEEEGHSLGPSPSSPSFEDVNAEFEAGLSEYVGQTEVEFERHVSEYMAAGGEVELVGGEEESA